MAKPSYDEVIEQRNAAREEAAKFKELAADFEADIADLRKQIEELTANPQVSANGELAAKLADALERGDNLERQVAELKKQIEGLTTPSENPFQWADALERVRELEAEKAELAEKLELLRLNPIGAQLANGLPGDPASAPAIHEIPDDDPADPRPEMHPALGWSDPAVIEWAERRRAKKEEPGTASE